MMETTGNEDFVNFKCSESMITCQICMDIFESPRILHCQHTFCKVCVVSLLKKHCLNDNGTTKKASFPCPNCRRECNIRKKGKRSIEDHLKCFPENRLMKTLLCSVDNLSDKHNTGLKDGKETQNYQKKQVHDTHADQEQDETLCTTNRPLEIAEHLWFYCLFMCKLQEFLTSLRKRYSGSLGKVGKHFFVTLLNRLLEIPRIKNNPDLYTSHASKYFDLHDIGTTLKTTGMLETQLRTTLDNIWPNGYHDTGYGYRNAQTQTENCYTFNIIVDAFKRQLHRFLLASLVRSTYSVVWFLDFYRLENRHDLRKIDYIHRFEIFFGKISYWWLAFKMFEIIFVTYNADISIYWPMSLCTISYVVFLVCFKRIVKYIGGGIYIGGRLPLFPVLLLTLHLYSNMNRGYVYCSAIIHIQFWLFVKVVFMELLPVLFFCLQCKVLMYFGKKNYFFRHGRIHVICNPGPT